VANGVRESLARLLARELEVELVEPAIPSSSQRRTLLEGAQIARVRGRTCDGFVIVRERDARALVALAFGESAALERPLSEIERATLERILTGLVPLCGSLCGTLGPISLENAVRTALDLQTYFEVRSASVPRIALGFGLSRDPPEEIVDPLGIEALGEIELEGAVEVAAGVLGVTAFTRLRPGTVVALESPLESLGLLRFGEVAFAHGRCGERAGRRAFALGAEDAA
ncbi:MAG: hypothetical protein ACREM2_12600, partial [Vulcanimicrobiaceae bacterium]